MNINPFEIKLVRQSPKSDDCLRSCAQMIFNYYADPVTKEVIWKKLHVYKKHSGLTGGYLVDLGRLAIKLGHETIIYHYDWHWWDKNTFEAAKKSTKSLIKSLSDLKKEKSGWGDKRIISKEILYLKKGGKFKLQMPTLSLIDSFLQQKIPVILLVRAEDLYLSPKENYNHSIIVTSKKENLYLIKDSYFALEEIKDEDLLYSWIRGGGWMIVILPKLDKIQVLQEKLNL